MIATVTPADGMIAVLSDAIASKRDTIALLERAAKEAQADLHHLREVRAVRLARAAGFEVGQVWLTETRRGKTPAIIFEVRSSYYADGQDNDWKLLCLFEPDGRHGADPEDVAWHSCVGRIDSGPILDKFATLARAVREQKEKAA